MASASAEPTSEPNGSSASAPAWTGGLEETLEIIRLEPDLERGRALYAVCAECHGPDGAGLPDGTIPQLAGQHRSVLIKQLVDIRSGLRSNPTMYPYVAQLEGLQQLADLAGYIETLPAPTDNGIGPGGGLERGRELYERSCARCHGERGEGSAEALYPRLQGQHYRYLVRQMIDVADGRRGNAHAEMVAALADFSAADVALVADYLSRLRVEPTTEADPETRPETSPEARPEADPEEDPRGPTR
jgi:cytochrome c553